MKFVVLHLIAALATSAAASAIRMLGHTSEEAALAARAPGKNCPEYLKKPYVAPYGVYQIQATKPNKQFGNSNVVRITPNDTCTILNYLLPTDAAFDICNLKFNFPTLDQLAADNPGFTYNAPADGGWFFFSGYTGYGAQSNVTYKTQPPAGPSFENPPPRILRPGHSYTLMGNLPCIPNVNLTAPGFLSPEIVGGKICSNDTSFTYTQSYKACSIGIFVEYGPVTIEGVASAVGSAIGSIFSGVF